MQNLEEIKSSLLPYFEGFAPQYEKACEHVNALSDEAKARFVSELQPQLVAMAAMREGLKGAKFVQFAEMINQGSLARADRMKSIGVFVVCLLVVFPIVFVIGDAASVHVFSAGNTEYYVGFKFVIAALIVAPFAKMFSKKLTAKYFGFTADFNLQRILNFK